MPNANLLSASSSASWDDRFEDGCSICLESFSSLNPPAVTECKHGYHFQCILEWSQQSNECPICSQHLVLKDHTSQELIFEVQGYRTTKSRHDSYSVELNIDANNRGHQENRSDSEQRIRRHFTSVDSRARNISRRRSQMIPVGGRARILPSIPISNRPKLPHANNSLDLDRNLASCLSDIDSPALVGATTVTQQASLSMSPSFGLTQPHTSETMHYSAKPSEPMRNIPGRSSMSEFATFSESIRSKISSTSIKYKESISKSTRDLKEKLIARNESVKELRKGVQREMSTSIARMIERLDFKSKQAGASAVEPPNRNVFQRNKVHFDGISHFKSSDPSPYNANGRPEV